MIPEPCRRRKKKRKKKIKQIKNLTCSAQGRKKFLHGLRLKGGGGCMALRSIRKLLLTKCRARENHFQLQLVLVEWRFIRISYRVNREGLMPTGKKKKFRLVCPIIHWRQESAIANKNKIEHKQDACRIFFCPDMFSQIQKQEKMDVQRGLLLDNYNMKSCFSKTLTTVF